MTHAKRRRFRVERHWLSSLLIVVLVSVVAWLVIAVVLSGRSDWSLKDWHLVLGEFVFFVFGFIVAMSHERSLDKEAELTTALGDLEMLEKIVVARMHTESLRGCAERLKNGEILPEKYESEVGGHALSLFGDARAGMALFRYARPAYQYEFACAILKAMDYAVDVLDLDDVGDVADDFAQEARALRKGHGGESSDKDDDLSARSRSLLEDAAYKVRTGPAVGPTTPLPSRLATDTTAGGSKSAIPDATPPESAPAVTDSRATSSESSGPVGAQSVAKEQPPPELPPETTPQS